MFKKLLASSHLPLAVCMLIMLINNAQAQYSIPKFDVQGHRGARGLMPENSIAGFKMALDSGVTTLEMDLAVTKDKQLVVSHEPWMNFRICLDPSGNSIDSLQGIRTNIFQLTYEQVKQWDCGSIGNFHFPNQQKIKSTKPLLKDVINEVETHIKSYSRYEVDYNIEIKTDPRGDNRYHPSVEEYCELVIKTISEHLPLQRVIIQSFDFRVLKYLHKHYPLVRLSALIESPSHPKQMLNELGFTPEIYSPNFQSLNAEQIKFLHRQKISGNKKRYMRVIPWTVNSAKDLRAIAKDGVDGVITDYPNRAKALK